ncbi:hypothetical protein EON65_38840 [archaeon]|nr:MAG: hypothetical protein EON65_38840 [archaeon]
MLTFLYPGFLFLCSRYFVLNRGHIVYHTDAYDSAPFGQNAKGMVCLVGLREINQSGKAVRYAG